MTIEELLDPILPGSKSTIRTHTGALSYGDDILGKINKGPYLFNTDHEKRGYGRV